VAQSTHLAAKFSRLEVRHDHNLLADQVLRLVPRLDPGADLAGSARSVVELDLDQLVGVGVRLGRGDRGHPQVELREVRKRDLRLGRFLERVVGHGGNPPVGCGSR
jgi:hypothetical protein